EDRALRAAPPRSIRGARIEPVLERVKIKARKILALKSDDLQIRAVQIEIVQQSTNARDPAVRLLARQRVERFHTLARHDRIGRKIEEVAGHETQAVAHVSIDAANLLDDVGAETHVVHKFDR